MFEFFLSVKVTAGEDNLIIKSGSPCFYLRTSPLRFWYIHLTKFTNLGLIILYPLKRDLHWWPNVLRTRKGRAERELVKTTIVTPPPHLGER